MYPTAPVVPFNNLLATVFYKKRNSLAVKTMTSVV